MGEQTSSIPPANAKTEQAEPTSAALSAVKEMPVEKGADPKLLRVFEISPANAKTKLPVMKVKAVDTAHAKALYLKANNQGFSLPPLRVVEVAAKK